MPRILLFERQVARFLRKPVTVRRAAGAIVSTTVVIVIVSGLLMRVLDHREYPNIFIGMWWAIQTVTTVGYGDVTPKAVAGRIVAAAVMLEGIAFVAIVTAAITSTFVARAEHLQDTATATENAERDARTQSFAYTFLSGAQSPADPGTGNLGFDSATWGSHRAPVRELHKRHVRGDSILAAGRPTGHANPAVVLAARFTGALRQRWLWHSGDEGLRRHVLNAVARVLPSGETRFARPRQSRQVSQATQRARVIDALDAAAMVHTSAVGELGDNEDLIIAFVDVPMGRRW